MAKGKKNVLKAGKNSGDAAQKPTSSKTETKENKPATNKEFTGKVQTTLQSFRSPCKQRSPLRDSSSVLIQDGNDSDAANLDTSRLKQVLPSDMRADGFESREQLAEAACPSDSVREQTAVQHESATAKVPTRSKAERRPRERMENKAPQSRKVTDYFPVRRSSRKTQAKLKDEKQSHIDDMIKNNVEEGMQVKHIEGKGRGVFAIRGFRKGDFVVEYQGDLLGLSEAKEREAKYAEDPQTGCYMYYFQYQSKTYCVDATKETDRLGRLINHSKCGNCQTRLHPIDGTPHLIMVASRDIQAEEELLYDYGDRSKSSISAHPWLKH